MAERLKRCTDAEISTILDSSESDTNNKVKKSSSKRRNLQQTEGSDNEDSSDSEIIFDYQKILLKKNELLKQKASLKLKLRRSTEQSQYKIDTDSECEKSTRKNGMHGKKSLSAVKKETETSNVEEVKQLRSRKFPRKYSDYECFNSPSVNSPTLRSKKRIDDDEDRLFTQHTTPSNIKRRESSRLGEKNKTRYSLKRSISFHEPENQDEEKNVLPKSNRKAKENRKSAVKNADDNEMLSKVTKVKSIRTCPVPVESTNNVSKNDLNAKAATPTKNNTERSSPKIVSASITPKRISLRRASRNILVDKENKTSNNDDYSEDEVDHILKTTKQLSITEIAATPKRKKNVIQEEPEAQNKKNLLSTPKSHSIKCSSLTPSMGKRTDGLLKPSTPLQAARSRLHVSAVPKSLPCREEEFNNIYTFLEGKLTDNTGGCIYISGVPGTGKTATVNEVIRCLKRSVSKGKLKQFEFVEINGMKLPEPRQAYVQIVKQLTGQTLTWEQAYQTLEKRFQKHDSRRLMTLLLVDELDLLCTKRQDVVYNLLDWPAKAPARLVVITIANTMDLPERVLMGRVTSRLGLTRLTFQPYNYKQLQEIVLTRLNEFNAFRNEAIQLVARKVAAVSGDARRALDICRRATEIAENRNSETVSMDDVNNALTEMIATAKVQAIKHCSQMEQIFLQAVCAETTRTGVEEVSFLNVYKQLESLCSFDGIRIPTITETLLICARLGSSRLLICEHSRADIQQRILLNVSTDDIHYALQKITVK